MCAKMQAEIRSCSGGQRMPKNASRSPELEKRHGRDSLPAVRKNCNQTIAPESDSWPSWIKTNYSYLSFKRKLQREKNKTWLELTRPKMEEDLTSSWASLYAHCIILARWMTHPPMSCQLMVAMTTTRKAQTRTEKESCISSRSTPHHSCHEYSSHSFQFFTSTLLCIWYLHLIWIENLICSELGSRFLVIV